MLCYVNITYLMLGKVRYVNILSHNNIFINVQCLTRKMLRATCIITFKCIMLPNIIYYYAKVL